MYEEVSMPVDDREDPSRPGDLESEFGSPC